MSAHKCSVQTFPPSTVSYFTCIKCARTVCFDFTPTLEPIDIVCECGHGHNILQPKEDHECGCTLTVFYLFRECWACQRQNRSWSRKCRTCGFMFDSSCLRRWSAHQWSSIRSERNGVSSVTWNMTSRSMVDEPGMDKRIWGAVELLPI